MRAICLLLFLMMMMMMNCSRDVDAPTPYGIQPGYSSAHYAFGSSASVTIYGYPDGGDTADGTSEVVTTVDVSGDLGEVDGGCLGQHSATYCECFEAWDAADFCQCKETADVEHPEDSSWCECTYMVCGRDPPHPSFVQLPCACP